MDSTFNLLLFRIVISRLVSSHRNASNEITHVILLVVAVCDCFFKHMNWFMQSMGSEIELYMLVKFNTGHISSDTMPCKRCKHLDIEKERRTITM